MSDARIEFVRDGEPWVCEYRDEDHAYFVGPVADSPLGKRKYRYPGVSTLAKVGYVDSDPLMGWAVKEHKAGRDFTASREQSAEWGTAAHAQLEALATTGTPLSLTDQPEHVRGCVQAVASWWIDIRPTFVASEVVVCSVEHRYAGRFDGLAEVDGRLVIFDLKTSKPMDWERWAKDRSDAAYAQMAGYCLGYRELYPDEVQPEARYILRVTADGEWDWQRDISPESSDEFFVAKARCYTAQRMRRQAVAAQRKAMAA